MRKGTKSVQYGFKVTKELADRMEEERKIDGTTLAGFFNDALKHYIDYRENRCLELWKMHKETDCAEKTDFTKNTKGGRPDELR